MARWNRLTTANSTSNSLTGGRGRMDSSMAFGPDDFKGQFHHGRPHWGRFPPCLPP